MMTDQKLYQSSIATPVGTLLAVYSDRALHYLLWDFELADFVQDLPTLKVSEHQFLTELKKQIAEYFAGERQEFTVALEMKGTDFQKKVWALLMQIPFGKTWSYTDQARALKSQAVRAVGSANAKNPINLIVPCHRVRRSDGTLGGYAGGLEIKQKLLDLEQELLA